MSSSTKDQCLQLLKSLKDQGQLESLLKELDQARKGSDPRPSGSMHDGAKRRLFSPGSQDPKDDFELLRYDQDSPPSSPLMCLPKGQAPCQLESAASQSGAAPFVVFPSSSLRVGPMSKW